MDTIRINPLIVSVSPSDHTLISPIQPTVHKGGIGKLISVVAMVAIPFAAPIVASSIGLSSAIATAVGSKIIGTVVGSAMAGAALGAVSAAVTGQDVGTGALYGGLGGALGGYSAGTEAAAAADAAAGTSSTEAAGLTLTDGATAGVETTTTTPGLVKTSLQTVGEEGVINATKEGFMETLKNTGSAVLERITDPERLATITLQAAISMGASMVAPEALPAMTPEEKQLTDARVKELEVLRVANKQVYDDQLLLAQQLMVDAGYIDPVQFGLDRENKARILGARANKQSFREAELQGKTVTGGDMARANYGVSRDAASAYAAGQQEGITQRDAAVKNAYASMPNFNTDYLTQTSSLSKDLREASKAGIETAQAKEAQIAQNLAGLVMTPVAGEKKAQPAEEDELQKAIGGNQSYGAGLIT